MDRWTRDAAHGKVRYWLQYSSVIGPAPELLSGAEQYFEKLPVAKLVNKFSALFCIPVVDYRAHNNLPLFTVLTQMKPVQAPHTLS